MSNAVTIIQRMARLLSRWELVLTALLVPFLVFSTLNAFLTAFAAGSVAVLWLARWIARGAVTRRTPLDVFILGLLVMTPIALWASPLPRLSVEAACRVIAGVALYYAWVNAVESEHIFRITLMLAVVGGLAVALAGLAASDWNQNKIPFLEPVYSLLPNLSHLFGALASEQDSTPGAFHPNFIGATLAMLIPIASAVWVTSRQRIARIATALVVFTMLVVLLLTQSRLSMAALTLASGVVFLRVIPSLRRPALVLAGVGGVAIALIGPQRVLEALTPSVAATGFGTWEARVALWRVAFQILVDFPFTGIGLAAFYPAATYLYAVGVPPTWAFGHTHETYLQMGMDFGVVGLIAFAAMLLNGLRLGWPRSGGNDLGRLRIGVWTGLLTYILFGIFDGIPMWTKPGFLIWLLLAWVVVGQRLSVSSDEAA
jgi:O-antigen ligase